MSVEAAIISVYFWVNDINFILLDELIDDQLDIDIFKESLLWVVPQFLSHCTEITWITVNEILLLIDVFPGVRAFRIHKPSAVFDVLVVENNFIEICTMVYLALLFGTDIYWWVF